MRPRTEILQVGGRVRTGHIAAVGPTRKKSGIRIETHATVSSTEMETPRMSELLLQLILTIVAAGVSGAFGALTTVLLRELHRLWRDRR